ncbi:MAG: helix-hairpin-helix domain-containing protein [Bacteroidales bacterium]
MSIFFPEFYDLYRGPAKEKDIEAFIYAGVCCIPEPMAADSDSVSRQEPGNGNYSDAHRNDLPDTKRVKFQATLTPVFDLNQADSLDLLSLPGIGPYFAKAILRYREILGGYVSVNQLLEIYGMNKEKLDKLKPKLKLDTTGLRKLPVNAADFKTILKHPYCNYLIAKSLINFRQQYGKITQMDELLKSGIMPDSTYRKMLPYMVLE